MLFIGKFILKFFVLLIISSVISSISFQADVIPYVPAFFIFPILTVIYVGFNFFRKSA